MKIYVTSVFVDDQEKARDFYTRVLGFAVRHDVPMGAHRWLTVAEPDNPRPPSCCSSRAFIPPSAPIAKH